VCKALRNARVLMGRALIAAYKDRWIPRKREVDKIIEEMVMGGKWLKEDMVQGGDVIPPQEVLLHLKENNKNYIALLSNIEKMERIIESLTDEQVFILEEHFWRGIPWYEVADVISVSRTTFFRKKYDIEEYVGAHWKEGE